MDRKWFRRLGAMGTKVAEARPRSSMRRQRWKSPELAIQELEHRTLLSVVASLNSGVLDVNLTAANDQAQITPSGSSITVSGTDYSSPDAGDPNTFAGVNSIVVLGTNTTTNDDPNESVTFGASTGGTITLNAASGTDALNVSGVTTVAFTDITIDATSGDVSVTASETTAATSELVALSKPVASISVGGTGSTAITADNVTFEAVASSSYTYSAPLGGVVNDVGIAAAIADVEPSASVTVEGSSINVNGDGNVTIASNASASVMANPTVGLDGLNPVAAAIATSVVNSSAVTNVTGSTVNAGSGTVNISSTNTTNVTTEVDGSSGIGGASAAVTVDNTTSQADVAGGSTVSGGTVNVTATTTNTASTTANSTVAGAGDSILTQIENILAGDVNPYYTEAGSPEPPTGLLATDVSAPADTAKSDGSPLSVAGSLAVSRFTPTTQAYVDSSSITGTTAINIGASSDNNTTTVADGDATSSEATAGVGVAVAINDADESNTATVESTTGATTLSSPTISVQATTPTASPTDIHDASASATAGASGAEIALAGSLAVNLVSNTSEASVPSGSTVTITNNTQANNGSVTFNAQDSANEAATAQPAGAGASGGGAFGIGASIALNVDGNTTLADLQDTAQLTGANNLAFTAGSNDTVTTDVVSGSAGGSLSISPSAAVTVVTNTTQAQVGAPDRG